MNRGVRVCMYRWDGCKDPLKAAGSFKGRFLGIPRGPFQGLVGMCTIKRLGSRV